MNPLSVRDALTLWEGGAARHPIDRALLLYAAACPQLPWPQLADAPIGRRDGALLELRRASFGPHIEAATDCPRCGERLALTLDLDALLQAPGSAESVEVDGATFRLPTSRDLATVAQEDDVAAAAHRLFALCRLPAGDPADAGEQNAWPDDAVARVDAALAAADPQADICLALACEACGHRFDADFDIAALLWQDVEAAARRALLDVDALARVYGWSEQQILALSEARRAAYVELAGR